MAEEIDRQFTAAQTEGEDNKMLIVKFINKDGTHSYEEVDHKFIDNITNPEADLLLIENNNKKYRFVGQKDLFYILKEVGIKEIRLGEIAPQIVKHNIKVAEKLLSDQDISPTTIDQFIDALRVKQNDPKIQQIKQLKQKSSLEALDKIRIKILWWEAKRESLYEQMKMANLKLVSADREASFLHQVLDELNTRITKAVLEYSKTKQQIS